VHIPPGIEPSSIGKSIEEFVIEILKLKLKEIVAIGVPNKIPGKLVQELGERIRFDPTTSSKTNGSDLRIGVTLLHFALFNKEPLSIVLISSDKDF
jgi:hypothetical protein